MTSMTSMTDDIEQLQTLEDAIRWGLAQPQECMIVEVIVQDEFTHDVVMTWRDDQHLVFDTT